MKSIIAALALSTALTSPSLAMARPVTLTTTLSNYGGDGAYLALYVTDAKGAYVGSLWMAGGKSKYYEHLTGWYRATGGNVAEINGITGASVGAGRTLDQPRRPRRKVRSPTLRPRRGPARRAGQEERRCSWWSEPSSSTNAVADERR